MTVSGVCRMYSREVFYNWMQAMMPVGGLWNFFPLLKTKVVSIFHTQGRGILGILIHDQPLCQSSKPPPPLPNRKLPKGGVWTPVTPPTPPLFFPFFKNESCVNFLYTVLGVFGVSSYMTDLSDKQATPPPKKKKSTKGGCLNLNPHNTTPPPPHTHTHTHVCAWWL